VRRWRRWEHECAGLAPARPPPAPRGARWWRSLVLAPVTQGVYGGVRMLLLGRLRLDRSFDFTAFLER
jgi:hypothetical protein